MTEHQLGRLERVELRDIWTHEATEFTPWLARPENLQILAETLGMELELEAQERSVGDFRADLLCKALGDDHWVLIENQLERTDHTHLGQLLTYAAGLEAVTIIWLAASFSEQHRATLDWLNRITNESFRFFGVEVELFRIGDLPAAPRFNVVSKPNNWSRSVGELSRAIDRADLSPLRQMQFDYWTALHNALVEEGGPVHGRRSSASQNWMTYSIGRSAFHLQAVMLRPKRQIRADMYMQGEQAQARRALLKQLQVEIERNMGCPLIWDEQTDGIEARISVHLDNTDPEDRSDWPRQHEWLAKRLNDLYRAFAGPVRALE